MVVSPNDTIDGVIQEFKATIDQEYADYYTPESIAENQSQQKAFIDEMERAYKGLPKFLQEWVSSSDDSKYQYSRPCKIGIAKDAYLVASALKTPQNIESWYKLDHEQKIATVKGLCKEISGLAMLTTVKLATEYLNENNASAKV
jgi:hypothetical protein